MSIRCVWEHNGNDTLLYCIDYPGAYARGSSFSEAAEKIPAAVRSYCKWCGGAMPADLSAFAVQEKCSELNIADADSDVIFEEEKAPLSLAEYQVLKALVLRSASDFERLYRAVPDKEKTVLPARKTFYGHVPRTAAQMYAHTKSVNAYYFGEIGVEADNEGFIPDCRRRGFEQLEMISGFLEMPAKEGSYGEWWSLRKVMRRFLWHDRIHARAMLRMAEKTFPGENIENPFCF